MHESAAAGDAPYINHARTVSRPLPDGRYLALRPVSAVYDAVQMWVPLTCFCIVCNLHDGYAAGHMLLVLARSPKPYKCLFERFDLAA